MSGSEDDAYQIIEHMIRHLGWDRGVLSVESYQDFARDQVAVDIYYKGECKMQVRLERKHRQLFKQEIRFEGLPTPLDFTKHLLLTAAGH